MSQNTSGTSAVKGARGGNKNSTGVLGNTVAELDITGDLAHFITLCALFIYAYALIGCYVFKPSFLRQLAYIFQLIRIFLTFGILLPCILHWQATYMFPEITSTEFPFVVIAFLILNIFTAIILRMLLDYAWVCYACGAYNTGKFRRDATFARGWRWSWNPKPSKKRSC